MMKNLSRLKNMRVTLPKPESAASIHLEDAPIHNMGKEPIDVLDHRQKVIATLAPGETATFELTWRRKP